MSIESFVFSSSWEHRPLEFRGRRRSSRFFCSSWKSLLLAFSMEKSLFFHLDPFSKHNIASLFHDHLVEINASFVFRQYCAAGSWAIFLFRGTKSILYIQALPAQTMFWWGDYTYFPGYCFVLERLESWQRACIGIFCISFSFFLSPLIFCASRKRGMSKKTSREEHNSETSETRSHFPKKIPPHCILNRKKIKRFRDMVLKNSMMSLFLSHTCSSSASLSSFCCTCWCVCCSWKTWVWHSQ